MCLNRLFLFQQVGVNSSTKAYASMTNIAKLILDVIWRVCDRIQDFFFLVFRKHDLGNYAIDMLCYVRTSLFLCRLEIEIMSKAKIQLRQLGVEKRSLMSQSCIHVLTADIKSMKRMSYSETCDTGNV